MYTFIYIYWGKYWSGDDEGSRGLTFTISFFFLFTPVLLSLVSAVLCWRGLNAIFRDYNITLQYTKFFFPVMCLFTVHIYICNFSSLLYAYTRMYVCMYECIYVSMHVYMYMYFYIHIYTYIYIYIYVYIYIYICTGWEDRAAAAAAHYKCIYLLMHL